jgi:hypothetical protein
MEAVRRVYHPAMRKGLAAIGAVYLCLGAVYAFSDSPGPASRATPGPRQYPVAREVCVTESPAPGCGRPDPYLLTWDK